MSQFLCSQVLCEGWSLQRSHISLIFSSLSLRRCIPTAMLRRSGSSSSSICILPRSCKPRALSRQYRNDFPSSNLAACQSRTPSRRSFTSSTTRLVTRQRRKLFAWLDGPGKVFRNPTPGATNYLNAYLPDGSLAWLRSKDRSKQRNKHSEAGATTTNNEGMDEEAREDEEREHDSGKLD